MCLLVLTEYTNVTDRQTDRQTPHYGIGRAYAQHHAAKIGELSPKHATMWSRFKKLFPGQKSIIHTMTSQIFAALRYLSQRGTSF